MSLKPGSKIYFLGIGGTGMASVAGLCKEAGFQVVGSDANMYPPMSTMLEELKIPVRTPYDPKNIESENPDLVIVANALSRGHPELEKVLEQNLKYTSFPALCGEEFLSKRTSIVVTGTHGKTTTTSLMAHILTELKHDPGFIIGGIPKNFPRSFRLGKGTCFAIEGDEYDTAFFDKGPKFLHYCPKYLIVNNIEFDHADIYKDVEAIEEQFAKIMQLVPSSGAIIANVDDARVAALVKKVKVDASVVSVATLGLSKDADVKVLNFHGKEWKPGIQKWFAEIETRSFGKLNIETLLTGKHNIANIAQIVACIDSLSKNKILNCTKDQLEKAFASFAGVQRRLEFLASAKDIEVYEDFAHHPTAVGLVIEGFKAVHPKRRLLVAFEPKNATSRRNTFQNDYVSKLGLADLVFIGPRPDDKRIVDDQKMDTNTLASSIGGKARAFDSNEKLLESIKSELQPGDSVIFMSSSSFSGIQHQLAKYISKI